MSTRKILVFVAVFLSFLVFSSAQPSHANKAERILDFQSWIKVHQDGSMTVTENIKVVCAQQQIKRGIYRDFPTTYKDRYGNRVKVRFEVVSVLRNASSEPYHIKDVSNGKRVYIGQKSVFLKPGEYNYTITYKTNRQLGFFEDFDELYWNVTGNGWNFVIDKVEAVVQLPQWAEILQSAGYTGQSGEKGQDFEISYDEQGNIIFSTTRRLMPREGLTIAVSWPKGVVIEPTTTEKMGHMWKDNRSASVAAFGLLVLVSFYLLAWSKVGKDPEEGTIIPLFFPPKWVSPALARLIMRIGSSDDKLFAVAVVNMAVKGFLTIKEDEDNVFTLKKTGAGEACLSGGESKIARKLFGSSSKIKLKKTNHSEIGGAKEELQKYLMKAARNKYFIVNKGYFVIGLVITGLTLAVVILGASNLGLAVFITVWLSGWSVGCLALGATVISAWRGFAAPGGGLKVVNTSKAMGITLFAMPFFAGEIFGLWIFSSAVSPLAAVTIVLIIGINAIFYHLLKAPTLSGRKLMDEIEGFKLYLSVAERERLNILNPPEKTPELFEKYLPYALALDVEHEWSEQFAEVLAAASATAGGYRPTWYTGNSWRSWNTADFTSSLGTSLPGAISSSSTAPGSSSGSGGGGSSGGGGGGGGGGGW